MKITRISAYQVDLPLADGPYNWSGGNTAYGARKRPRRVNPRDNVGDDRV